MTQYFRKEGLDKLKQELEQRKVVTRGEITKRILTAKELGDLKENAEYTEAKEAQAFNEGRIAEIEDILKEAEVISSNKSASVIGVGSTIKIKSEHGEKNLTIVGPSESDPANGFISNESPLGQAFLGHEKGDQVEIKTPAGIVRYKVTDIC